MGTVPVQLAVQGGLGQGPMQDREDGRPGAGLGLQHLRGLGERWVQTRA